MLVVQVEQHVVKRAQRRCDFANRTKACLRRGERGASLTWKLPGTEQHELQQQLSCPKPLDQREQPPPAHWREGAVPLVNRFGPVRPDTHETHAPADERLQIAIAWWHRAERIE